MSIAGEVTELIAAAADPTAAAELARYFQVRPGGYGEHDHFVGVRLSVLRDIVKRYRHVRFDPADWLPLLHSRFHEHRLAALVAMAGRADRGDEAERGDLYASYLANTAAVNNWDLVDASAPQVVGGWLLHRDHAPLDALAASSVLWERRIAVVATHRFIRAGQSTDTYRLALQLRSDREDLIHKAVGWMLREAGRRVDGGELRAFLDTYADQLPRITLRYAIEHFSVDERARYRMMGR